MTSFNPRLGIRRLTVKRGVKSVYSADFHPGLNIIRGENSSGKSTLLDFLFYGLGGDLTEWREAALGCSEVILEVSLNGHPAVFAREVSKESGRPMRILTGDLSELETGIADWALHPYRRSQSKESFSQVIFRLLGMPEVTGDASSNVTMHQILRLLYADQLSPVDRIFRFERFDTELTRQTAGDLLCGGYDNKLYRQQLRLREADKEWQDATSEWKNAMAAFDGTKHSATMEWVQSEREQLSKQLADTRAEAEALEERIFAAEVSDGLSIEAQQKSYSDVVKAQQNLFNLQSERDALQLEIADAQSFILALEAKLDQLRDASVTAETLKGIAFIYCPSCFAPVEDLANGHACALCKSPFDQGRAHSRILALVNDTGLQIKQSRSIQADRGDELINLDIKLAAATRRWSGISEQYKLLNRTASTELRNKARVLYGQAGYLERQLEDLGQKSVIIERISALSEARRILTEEISKLKQDIEASEIGQAQRLRSSYGLISHNTAEFLRSDLLRQDTFAQAKNVMFSFGADRLSVNGESFFSASSMVYLRNSFFAGFFKSAITDTVFRHPRILILDTVEDKGMEPERSHHFQNQLAALSAASEVDHQLIYATAMISPSLQDSAYVIDRFYTHENRTLDLS